jgi:phosphatidylserine decarboxylase
MKIKLSPLRIEFKKNTPQRISLMIRSSKEIVTEDTPGRKQICFLYQNVFGKMMLHLFMKKRIIQCLQGTLMDYRFSKYMIKSFVQYHDINLEEAQKSITQFSSFNDFFTRSLKKDARMIDNDPHVLISPADGRILVFPKAHDSMKFYVKNHQFDLESFIGDNRLYSMFKNASMAIIRLAPVDYHRYHFPYQGTPETPHLIKGDYYSVSPLALKCKPDLFCQNKRMITYVKNEQDRDYLMIEVGATFVGSIIQSFQPDTHVEKSDEKGYFKFGGSTVVLLFKEDAIQFDQDLLENTRNKIETLVKMGERIAIFKS